MPFACTLQQQSSGRNGNSFLESNLETRTSTVHRASGLSQSGDSLADVLGKLCPVTGQGGQFGGDGCGGLGGALLFRLGGVLDQYGCHGLEVVGQVVNGDVRVDVHRQVDGAVAREGLGVTGMDAGTGEVGDEGVAQGMKVGIAVEGVLVRDASGRQVDLDHLRALPARGPVLAPQPLACRSVCQPLTEHRGHVLAQR